ncbi:hypothetical protein ACFE04_028237 [Oxalis oulophora]
MVVNLSGKLRLALGSVKDHASIGKAMLYNYNNSDGFSNIEIAVVRATGHDHGSIDDQHMHEILFLVSNSPGSIPFLADRISRRLGKTRDPLVALKTLLLIHRLLRGGNRYFEQQLRTSFVSGHLQLSTTWWFPMVSSDPFILFLHKYSSYLEERMGWVINQAGKLDPVMYQQDSLEFHCYEEKSIDMVFRKLPKCQVFIDKVLHFFPLLKDSPLDNNLAQAAMINTLKESFQVYMTFCEGVAALVNMYFDFTRPARALACEILKRASRQSILLHDMFEYGKRVMKNKGLEYPDVQIIMMEHVLALEQCLGSLELNKRAPIVNCLTKSTDLGSAAITSMKGKKNGGVKAPTTTLFSCSLETKISKVWVVFEDEDYKASPMIDGIPCVT